MLACGLADRLGKMPHEIGQISLEDAAMMAAYYRLQEQVRKTE